MNGFASLSSLVCALSPPQPYLTYHSGAQSRWHYGCWLGHRWLMVESCLHQLQGMVWSCCFSLAYLGLETLGSAWNDGDRCQVPEALGRLLIDSALQTKNSGCGSICVLH